MTKLVEFSKIRVQQDTKGAIMSVESNINMYYEEVVASMAERAQDDIDNGVEEYEAITTAIDDGLMYYTDQAYVLAFMLQGGFIRWGDPVDWDIIF